MKHCLLALLLFLAILPAIAQNKVISGVVTGPDGKPIHGATVTVKGTQTATVTDKDGHYRISVTGANSKLVISSVGYGEKEIAADATSANVSLALKSTVSEEVVVIGYGVTKKKDLTGSVAKANIKDMSNAPVMSIAQSLQGRVAGVNISSGDGQPGNQANIVIRGANSITQSNAPLYVVDGMPIENFNLNLFNPDDIESIEVLKDASSTAIYGARGANGVIMVTTKKGKQGAPLISFNTTQGLNQNTKKIATLSSYDFVKLQLERDPSVGSEANQSPNYFYLTKPGLTLDNYKDSATTDWQAPFFRNGYQQNYALAMRGGNNGTLYSISGSYDNVSGTIINTGMYRYQGRVSLDQQVNSKLKVGVNGSYAYMNQNGNVAAQSNFSSTLNIMYSVWGSNPLSKVTDDGIDPTTNGSNDYKYNPVVNQKNILNNTATNNLNVNGYINYTIVPGLLLRVTGSVNNTATVNQLFYNNHTFLGDPKTVFGSTNGANGSIQNAKVNNWTNENTLTYTKTVNKVHNFNVLGGFTMMGNTSSAYGFGANQVPNPTLGVNGLVEGTLVPTSTVTQSSLWNSASFLGRVNYNFNSKYYVTFSYRADGSSKFTEGNRWGYFPSGALAWRFSQEKFLKQQSWLSDGKLRLTYGKTGNNRVNDFAYAFTSLIDVKYGYAFNGVNIPTNHPNTMGNDNLKWETTEQVDAGLDLSFFQNRINLTADVYKKTTNNLLLNATLPPTMGYATQMRNVGSVQNEGLEIDLSTTNIVTKNFKWTSSFNIAFNNNKVLALTDNQNALYSAVGFTGGSSGGVGSGTPAYIAEIGKQLGLMYGFKYDGLYQVSDFNQVTTATGMAYVLKDNVTSNGNTRSNIQPGDIKYADLNGDKTINASDYTVIGRSLPIHYGGFGNNFNYKNFDLNIFLQWSYGNNIQNANRMLFEGGSTSQNLNMYATEVNRWTPTNTQTNIPRIGGYYMGGYSSRTVEDGSYLRLKTASLGYNFSKSALAKCKIQSLRVFASAQNLWTWTKYSGLDPEVNVYPSVLTGGFDYSPYPRARTFALGANLNF
jgi:TonB-linked SusC/RagA family outer membrane protein